ncbi:MAG: hypothetical protein NZN45_05540 [Rhodovarius sp.]|nr:hypothetical protein [Rhodovarius sp.]
MELHLFHALIALHIVTGSIGAIAFWVPVLGRKGGEAHRRWGRIFTICMLATGSCAIAMSLLTLYEPIGTHPHLEGRFDTLFIRAIFGWLMLHMGILTVNLAWYGWECVRNRRNHAANARPLNLSLQWAVLAAAINCAIQGSIAGQYLMLGLAVVGVATGVTNLRFIRRSRPGPLAWQREHLKGLVGCGISVYTAFMAFGAVRLMPELALHPGMWAIPLVVGLGMILYHWWRLGAFGRRAAAS